MAMASWLHPHEMMVVVALVAIRCFSRSSSNSQLAASSLRRCSRCCLLAPSGLQTGGKQSHGADGWSAKSGGQLVREPGCLMPTVSPSDSSQGVLFETTGTGQFSGASTLLGHRRSPCYAHAPPESDSPGCAPAVAAAGGSQRCAQRVSKRPSSPFPPRGQAASLIEVLARCVAVGLRAPCASMCVPLNTPWIPSGAGMASSWLPNCQRPCGDGPRSGREGSPVAELGGYQLEARMRGLAVCQPTQAVSAPIR